MGKDKKTAVSQPQHSYPPVVAVLGHVDHGKTTLLDTVRKTNIASGEHGGITQKIGASSIEIMHDGQKQRITFLDTPGHEAFSKMRSRGAMAADIALLIISCVDGVMPQTRESIKLLQDSKTPFIVVLTKSDLAERGMTEKTKQQLLKENVMVEGLGGDVPVIEVSAKTGSNVQELLGLILLLNEMQQRKDVSPTGALKGIVIESKLDQKSGPRASIVIKNGTIRFRDMVVCDGIKAKVKAITNDVGKQMTEATIGDAVEVLGFEKTPSVGGIVVTELKEAPVRQVEQPVSQEPYSPHAKTSNLSVILCTDTEGALEAILHALPSDVRIVTKKTGEVSEADVLLAKATGAIILGFNIKVRIEVTRLASLEKVLFRNYTIIYELIDEVKDVLEGKVLAMEEKIYGTAKILASFPFEKTKVLGIVVMDGRVAKGDKVRLMRGESVVGESTVFSVRKGKEQVSKVEKGEQAGIILSPFLDFTIGDMIICHA